MTKWSSLECWGKHLILLRAKVHQVTNMVTSGFQQFVLYYFAILQVVKRGCEPQPVPSSQWACFPLVSAKDDERWRPPRIPQRTDDTLRETCLPVTLNGNITKHAWKICETLKCSGNDLYRNYRNCNCFSCCNSKTTTTDVAAFCCTCSCHLQLTIPPTTSSLHHHSFCCFCELTYSHRKWKREFEESGLPGFGYESCSHESYSKQDMHQSWSKLIKHAVCCHPTSDL